MTKVVELLRVSSDLQASLDKAGLPAQHTTNVRTCSLYGLEVVETVEIVESGASVATSPAMARVLEVITSGRAHGIVLAEYSRLFRPDRWSDMIVLQTLMDHNAPIYLPAGPIDLQSEIGFVQATVNNMLAALERRRIRERMTRGKEEHRRRGAHMGGGIGIPFGLAWSKTAGWSYTPDIERVRELFRLFLSGIRNYEELGRQLGFPRTTARFLLGNPVYTGWRVYDEKRDPGQTPAAFQPGGDRKKIARPEQDVIRVRLPLEPIVSETDFALVQQLMSGIHQRHRRTTHRDAFAYRGHLECECGRLIYCNTNRFSTEVMHYNYLCPSRTKARGNGELPCATGFMRREKLEPVLDARLAVALTDPDFLAEGIAGFLASMDAQWRTTPADSAALETQRADLARRRSRVLDAYVDGALKPGERDARLRAIDRQVAALVRIATPAPALVLPDVTHIVNALVTTFAEWRERGRVEKLALLDALGAKIHIRRYDVLGLTMPFGASAGGHSKTADPAGISRIPLYIAFRAA